MLQALAGVILLGTPHSTSEDTKSWQSKALLLQIGIVSKKKDSVDQKDVEGFTGFSLDFEKGNIVTPILSVYDIQPKKIKTSLLSTKKLHVSDL